MRVLVKKSAFINLGLFVAGSIIFSSCLKEKEGSANIADEVTYENTIKGLLKTRGCEGCHAGQPPVLTDYTKVKDNFSKVLASIKHEAGTSNMPKGGSKLPDEEIKAFEDWQNNAFKEK